MRMVLKRKRKREYYKELKIVRGVFDERTLLVLYRLLNKNKISAESLIKEGKESVILSGTTKDGNLVAIKVYCVESCNFKSMRKYLIGDPRFPNIRKKRRVIVNVWCQREFKNLMTAYENDVYCPEPIDFKENVLIMSFIGEKNEAAPRLIDVILEEPEDVYKIILENLNRLVKAGLVHGDLSAYNILFWGRPYFIDLSHGTMIKNPLALELLRRDVENINTYFSKLGVSTNTENIYKKLKRLMMEEVGK